MEMKNIKKAILAGTGMAGYKKGSLWNDLGVCNAIRPYLIFNLKPVQSK